MSFREVIGDRPFLRAYVEASTRYNEATRRIVEKIEELGIDTQSQWVGVGLQTGELVISLAACYVATRIIREILQDPTEVSWRNGSCVITHFDQHVDPADVGRWCLYPGQRTDEFFGLNHNTIMCGPDLDGDGRADWYTHIMRFCGYEV